MVWYNILAWVIIAVAFAVAIAWCIKRIICPTSHCESCDKECALRKKRYNN